MKLKPKAEVAKKRTARFRIPKYLIFSEEIESDWV
jgi:hypothetical protein